MEYNSLFNHVWKLLKILPDGLNLTLTYRELFLLHIGKLSMFMWYGNLEASHSHTYSWFSVYLQPEINYLYSKDSVSFLCFQSISRTPHLKHREALDSWNHHTLCVSQFPHCHRSWHDCYVTMWHSKAVLIFS